MIKEKYNEVSSCDRSIDQEIVFKKYESSFQTATLSLDLYIQKYSSYLQYLSTFLL